MLAIAHRLSTVVAAHRIVVLERGRVRAVGTHAELVRRDELYAGLAATQFSQSERPYPSGYAPVMDAARRLREARRLAGLSQAELARRAGTSQATVSAYESARKQPSVTTLSRLLAAAGARLTVEHGRAPVVLPSPADHARAGRALGEVLSLAASLPVRHERRLRYPPLRPVAGRAA